MFLFKYKLKLTLTVPKVNSTTYFRIKFETITVVEILN